MKEEETNGLLGTVWRHKKKGGIYRLTQAKRDSVYLQAETKGCRSTWKHQGLLTWDYELVHNVGTQKPGASDASIANQSVPPSSLEK